MKRLIILLTLLFLIAISCVKFEPVSTVPEITFESLEAYLGPDYLGNLRTKGLLKFSFVDGDADIGLYESDSVPDSTGWDERNFNVFLIPYQKIDTSYYLIELDSSNPPPYYKIWHNEKLDRVGQNKTVKGIITLDIEDLPQYDTIRFNFYIRDRAGNNSNVETTTDIGTKINTDSFSGL